jgi:hypothetical protein
MEYAMSEDPRPADPPPVPAKKNRILPRPTLVQDFERALRKTGWQDGPAYSFELVGGIWHTRCGTDRGDFADNEFSGLGYIAKLFSKPGTPIPVADLYHIAAPLIKQAQGDRTFDRQSKAKVDAKEKQLEDQIHEALEAGVSSRAEELGGELQRLREANRRDASKRGKARRLNQTPQEKAAECVRKAIKAIKTECKKRGLLSLVAQIELIHKETTTFTYRPPNPPPPWVIRPNP